MNKNLLYHLKKDENAKMKSKEKETAAKLTYLQKQLDISDHDCELLKQKRNHFLN